jgi:hypothetical protein
MARSTRLQVIDERERIPISPFLLPTCTTCGAAMNLLCVEPHANNATREMRTFGCTDCGGQLSCDVPRPA